jgi:hypothetical protein
MRRGQVLQIVALWLEVETEKDDVSCSSFVVLVLMPLHNYKGFERS